MEASRDPSERIGVHHLEDLISELRLMARSFLNCERSHSFTPTALAMTALLRVKLAEQDWNDVRWENRAHFFSCLAQAMKHALIDHARRRRAKGRDRVAYFPPDEDFFRELSAAAEDHPERVLLLGEAVDRLEAADPRLGAVIRQFYYLGYSISEIATVFERSEKTVDRDLKKGRTLLRKFLDELATPPG